MISDQIIKKYEDNINELPPMKRMHWLIRRYRTQGSQKYIPLIRAAYVEILPKMKETLGAFTGDKKVIDLGKKKLIDYRVSSPRKIKRLAYYKESPQALVYMEGVLYMFLIKSLGLEDSAEISDEFNRASRYLRQKNIGRVFLNKNFLVINPSENANIINSLAFLGISDDRPELVRQSKEYWLNVEPEDPSIWLDKIYALTHLIIAASNYYQNFVVKKDFDWVFNYFENNIDAILQKANVDSVGEVALCYKLVKDSKNRIVGLIQHYLMSKFDKKAGFIPNERAPSFRTSEHRNIVATMVLDKFEKLYKGPNLF